MAPGLRRASGALAILFCIALACAPPKTQEQQVREALTRIDAALAAKDTKALRAAISERYLDAKKRTKEDLSAFITYFLFKQKDVYTFSFVYDVELPAPGEADATVYAALAAAPLTSRDDIARFDADLWKFEVELHNEEGVWRVRAADWTRVDPRDATELLF